MPLRFFRLPEKDALAAKLVDYPVLNSLLRMMLYERIFRLVLVGSIILVLSTALFILKIWTVTPKGFAPKIKLSGLDVVQAWSLRRTAVKQMAEGRFDDALYSWRVAVANNPVNLELLRGCLDHLLHGTDKRKCVPVATSMSRWLLRLTQTNLADLELSARLYQRFELDDLTLYTLAPLQKQLPPALEAFYLKALFNRKQIALFAHDWEEAQLRGVQFTDPEMTLYRGAYDAGWGLLSNAAEGNKLLEKAKDDPARRDVAHRLQLIVSEHLVQPEIYRKSLDFLQEWRHDRLTDHIGYWQLLAAVGRKSEALQLIERHVTPPASSEETVLLSKAYFDLGQPDKSREILQRYAPEFSDSEELWLSYSNLLISQQRWDNLIELALLLRHEDNPLRDGLAAYSYYVEGVAELGKGRALNATNAFKKIPTSKIRNKFWQLVIAEKLEGLGFADISKSILVNMQKDIPDNSRFWILLAKTAFDVRDPDLLVSALASAYKLRPDDFIVVNNYAAALLSTRQRPDEALRLTSRVVESFPDDVPPKINQVSALLQNQRLAEAETVLRTIDTNKLSEAELSSYHLASFELYLDQKRFEQAKQASEHIEKRYLMPPEIRWLSDAQKQIAPPQPASG